MKYVIKNVKNNSDVAEFSSKEAAKKALKTFLDHSHMFSLTINNENYVIEEIDDIG